MSSATMYESEHLEIYQLTQKPEYALGYTEVYNLHQINFSMNET